MNKKKGKQSSECREHQLKNSLIKTQTKHISDAINSIPIYFHVVNAFKILKKDTNHFKFQFNECNEFCRRFYCLND